MNLCGYVHPTRSCQRGRATVTRGLPFRAYWRGSAPRPLAAPVHGGGRAATRGAVAPADSLGMLEAAVAPSLARRRLVQTATGFEWKWTYDDAALDGLLAPVVESAAALLTSPHLARGRE